MLTVRLFLSQVREEGGEPVEVQRRENMEEEEEEEEEEEGEKEEEEEEEEEEVSSVVRETMETGAVWREREGGREGERA